MSFAGTTDQPLQPAQPRGELVQSQAHSQKLIYSCFVSFGLLLIFSIPSGHAFRKTAAGAFGPDLAKKLSQLVKMEKNVMRSMELVGRERMEVAVSPVTYILGIAFADMCSVATTLTLGRSM